MSTTTSSSVHRRRWEHEPASGAAQFGNADQRALRRTAERPDFDAIRRSADFADLRRRVRLFIFPAGAFFLLWYVGYVLIAAYAPAFMSQKLWGAVNVGLVLGLLQFVSTGALTLLYVRYARRTIDPRVDRIREQAGVDI